MAKYRRLQVGSIWLRSWFEVLALIAAIAICCTVVVTGYEKNFADYTSDFSTDNARQLARSVSLIVREDTVNIADAERAEYAGEQYSQLLDECFVDSGITYSGAIYRTASGGCELYAASDSYEQALRSAKLADKEGVLSYEIQQAVDAAASGRASCGAYGDEGDSYLAFEPVYGANGSPYAVVVTQVVHQSSVERSSGISTRLKWISAVCAVLLVIYYSISASRSSLKNKREEVVGVGK